MGVVGLAIVELVLDVSTDPASTDFRLPKILAAGVVFPFDFDVRKLIIFSKSSL